MKLILLPLCIALTITIYVIVKVDALPKQQTQVAVESVQAYGVTHIPVCNQYETNAPCIKK